MEVLRAAELQTELTARHMVVAVIERQLQDLRQVKVARENVRLVAERARLDAAACAAAAGVLERFACGKQLLHNRFRVVKRGLAPTLAADLACTQQELRRGLTADLHVGTRLEQLHVVHAVEDQIADLVDAVSAVRGNAAGVDVRKIGIGTALLERHADLRRGGLVVELDPEALKQLERLIARQASFGDVGAIERNHMLIEAARAVGVPGVKLARHSQMHKPVHLQRLMEGLRLMGRHDGAVLRDGKQIGLPLGIGLLRGHLARKLLVASAENHNGLAGNVHGGKLLFPVQGFPVVDKVEGIHRAADILLIVGQALLVNLVRSYRVSGAALLHKLREDAALIGRLPLLAHAAQNFVADGALLPVGNDLFFLDPQILLRDGEADQLALIHDLHILERVAAKLREGRRGLRAVALLTDNELAFMNRNGFILEEMAQRQRAQLRNGHRPLVFLIRLRLEHGALHINTGLRVETLLAQSAHALRRPVLLADRFFLLCHGQNSTLSFSFVQNRFR